MHRIGDEGGKSDIFGVGFELFAPLGRRYWAQVPSSLTCREGLSGESWK